MERLHNGFTLDIPNGSFPLSTDSMLLADFVLPLKSERVLDLGSGCGTLGVLLCAGSSSCQVDGIELTGSSHEAALRNIERNGLQGRMTSICADLRDIAQSIRPGSYSCCISNPPYFSGGPASAENPLARRDDTCTPQQLFQAAAWALKYGGDFYIVHKPEKLARLCACAVNAGLEPKRLRLVRHRADKPVMLILLQCRKGGKPGLVWEDCFLQNEDGSPSEFFHRVYHTGISL